MVWGMHVTSLSLFVQYRCVSALSPQVNLSYRPSVHHQEHPPPPYG